MTARRAPLLASLATMFAELCGIYLGLSLIAQTLGAGMASAALAMLAYPASFALGLLLSRSTRGTVRMVALSAAAGVLMVAGAGAVAAWEVLGGWVAGAGTGAILGVGFQAALAGLGWWLGMTLVGGAGAGTREGENRSLYHRSVVRFQIAILLLVVLAPSEGHSFAAVILFFAASMVALAAAKWESALRGASGVLRRPGALTILAGAAAAILPGIAIFLVLSPGAVAAIISSLSAFAAMMDLDRPSPSTGEPIRLPFSCNYQPDGEDMGPITEPPEGSAGPPDPAVIWALSIIMGLAVIGIVAMAVLKRRGRARAQGPVMPVVELTSGRVGLLAGLKDLFRRIGRWLLGMLRRLAMLRFRRARPSTGYESGQSVQQVYRDLLRWAAEQGVPRAASQTPLEYLGVLCRVFPQGAVPIATITGMYVEARYRHGPETPGPVEAARRAWQEIEALRDR